jgi:purine-binding chemotaxis protein CheW
MNSKRSRTEPRVEPHVNASTSRFLTFRVDAQLYALRSEDVAEVIRIPSLARIPQAPAALLGLANLRGSVLPLAGMRELLGKSSSTSTENARAIVLGIGAPFAVLVDAVEALETIETSQIETRKKELSAEGAEQLLGAFAVGHDKVVAKILDIKSLLEAAFATRARAERQTRTVRREAAVGGLVQGAADNAEMLVTFAVAGQEFALPLESVQEILPLPATSAAVARSEAVVLGMTTVRNTLLPLMSLRGLLGFEAKQSDDREKVIVAKIAGAHIGLVADEARAVLAADSASIDPLPPALAARTGGESRIKSVYRSEGGRRLVSILAPGQLFREDIMKRLAADGAEQAAQAPAVAAHSGAELIFLVFRLGGDEFGLPIEAVVEVAQVPEQITRLPKTPKFLEGVVNLRGDVLPVVDQRRRFDMPKSDRLDGRRLVVIKTQRHRAGLIVDSVSDVLRARADDVEPPPELTDATTRLVRGVINLENANRIVLLLDPTEVLTQAEQGLLERFQAASNKANA